MIRDIQKQRFNQDELEPELADIVAQVNKMAEITDNMGRFSRKTDMEEKVPVNMNNAINRCLKFVKQQISAHSIALEPDEMEVVSGNVV